MNYKPFYQTKSVNTEDTKIRNYSEKNIIERSQMTTSSFDSATGVHSLLRE